MQVYRDNMFKVMGMLLFAKTLGSVICFGLARNVISNSRKKRILANPTICKVNRVLSSSPIYYGTLCRLATMPTVVKNYGLALLEIRFRDYIVSTFSPVGLHIVAKSSRSPRLQPKHSSRAYIHRSAVCWGPRWACPCRR